jgi:uncharacterized integral membrane protein
MRLLRRLLLLGVFVALFVAAWRFVSSNSARIDLDLVLFQLHQLPLWSALLGAFALGASCAGASLLYELAKKSFAARRYRKELAGLESEIHQLRNLPLAAPDLPGGPAPPGRAAAGPRL